MALRGEQIDIYGVPVAGIARVGRAISLRLLAEAAFQGGDPAAAEGFIDQAIDTLKDDAAALDIANDPRLPGQTYQALGSIYEWKAFLLGERGAAEAAQFARNTALRYYTDCVRQGEAFPFDTYLVERIVGQLCAPRVAALTSTDAISQTPAGAPPTVVSPTLPPTAVPPTATRPIASAPPDIDIDAPGGSFPRDNVLFEVVVNPTYLFRMDVRDLTFGSDEGAGINLVEFSITGNGVDYFLREINAPYCVFGGGEPDCNPWPTDALGRYTWGEGGPLVQNGQYFASITVNAQREDPEFGNSWNWNFPFSLTLP